MSETYTVLQGDHLSSIAHRFGFTDYRTIWNDPGNAQLKSLRQDPHVLFPGDEVVIPDKATGEVDAATQHTHSFIVQRAPLELVINLEHRFGKPLSNVDCVFASESETSLVQTDSQGQVRHQVPPTSKTAMLSISETVDIKTGTVQVQRQILMKVGWLDPADEISGQIARLANLGYYQGSIDTPNQKLLASAVEEFQCDNGLIVDGICGPQTQARLKKVHGC